MVEIAATWCGKNTRPGLAMTKRLMMLRAKTGCFTLLLRGNLANDGGDCCDLVREKHPPRVSQCNRRTYDAAKLSVWIALRVRQPERLRNN
jgi:hypothetical protein